MTRGIRGILSASQNFKAFLRSSCTNTFLESSTISGKRTHFLKRALPSGNYVSLIDSFVGSSASRAYHNRKKPTC